MNIWEKIAKEIDFVEYINLNESAPLAVNWKAEDVTILTNEKPNEGGNGGQPSPNGGSKTQSVNDGPANPTNGGKKGEKDEKDKKGEKGDKPSKGGKGEETSNPVEDDQTGELEGGKPTDDKNKKGEWKKGTGKKLPGNEKMESIDDHNIMRSKSDGSKLDDALNKIHEKMSRRTGKKNPDDWVGAAGDMFRDDIKKVVRRRLPMDKIKNELAAFKEEISKAVMDDETYQLSVLSGSSRGGEADINRPVEIKDTDTDKKSAILFFCVDTSGSMGDEEFELVFGWLREIAEFFKSDSAGSGGIPGKVYIIEYDTRVYTPIREWRNDKLPMAPRGGGGNAVNCVYNFLNKHFVKTDTRGNLVTNSFVFKESDSQLFDNEDKKEFYDIEHEIETTYVKDDARQEQLKKLKSKNFKYGDVLKESFDYANVPFLLFFTDGYDDVPNAFGPLYRNNLGNILYVITSKAWLGNMRPRNFIYCDIHVESFSDSFDTDGNLVDNGQANRRG